MKKRKLICIMGPTAVGKTSLALNLAQKINSVIISADSIQVYKHLNIGTAKETQNELNSCPHFLIDILNPTEEWNAGCFKEKALEIISDLPECVVPIIAGGTGLYVKSLIYPFSFGNAEKNNEIRAKYEDLLQKNGAEFVYSLLKNIDPKSAEKLHPNETGKVVRALEIYETTGKLKSEQADNEKDSPFDLFIVVLNAPREVIYDRINKRVDQMIKNGLVEEARELFNNHQFNAQSSQAIGYKQLIDYFENKCSLEYAIDKIKQLSRNYAKRQLTFFKSFPDAHWFNTLEISQEEIINQIENFIK